jgi:TetR/AcrR family transcriptional regulator, transcriptional repressor for nem operon
MTAKLTARGAQTRDRIVVAASDVVSRVGVTGFTIDLVCEQAHVSKSQLYHFFESRDALLAAVADNTVHTVLSLQHDLFANLGSLDGFRTWVRALVDLQIERNAEGGCPIGSLHTQLDDQQLLAQRILRDGFSHWREEIQRGLSSMKESGQLPDSYDVDESSRLFLVALQGGLLLTDAYRDHTWLERALHERLSALEASLIQ